MEKKKNTLFTFSLKEAELQQIRLLARQQGKTISKLITQTILKK